MQFKFALFGALIIAAVLAAPTRDDFNPDAVVEEDIVPDTVESFTDLVQTEAKAPLVVQAIACWTCNGSKRCMAKKLKAARCSKLSGFTLRSASTAMKKYGIGLAKKDSRKVEKASNAFKKSMLPISFCNITPKKLQICIKKGLKLLKRSKKTKKSAKKRKKSAKKRKKSAKKRKKSAKKRRKSAKKTRKSAKRGKKGRKGSKGSKCQKPVETVMKTLKALLRTC